MQEFSTASASTIACPRCGTLLAGESFMSAGSVNCPSCRSQLTGRVFPAFWSPAPPEVQLGEAAMEGDATCYFHDGKKAALACESCGRFICALCEVRIGSRRVCPTCLGKGLKGDKIAELVTSRLCWSNSALLAGWLPLLFGVVVWPLLVITGPAAIFAALYGWNKPGSLTRGKRHWAAVLGLLGGIGQLVLVLGMGLLVWNAYPHV